MLVFLSPHFGCSYSFLGCLSRIYLAGQSAGAHIGACALLDQAKKEISEGPDELTWKAFQIKWYFALSGGLVGMNWNSRCVFCIQQD